MPLSHPTSIVHHSVPLPASRRRLSHLLAPRVLPIFTRFAWQRALATTWLIMSRLTANTASSSSNNPTPNLRLESTTSRGIKRSRSDDEPGDTVAGGQGNDHGMPASVPTCPRVHALILHSRRCEAAQTRPSLQIHRSRKSEPHGSKSSDLPTDRDATACTPRPGARLSPSSLPAQVHPYKSPQSSPNRPRPHI